MASSTLETIRETSVHVICKYSFLVLIFSFFTAVQVGFIEPKLKKLMKVGEPEDHVVQKESILIKGIIFFIGIIILFVVFQSKLIKCATGV